MSTYKQNLQDAFFKSKLKEHFRKHKLENNQLSELLKYSDNYKYKSNLYHVRRPRFNVDTNSLIRELKRIHRQNRNRLSAGCRYVKQTCDYGCDCQQNILEGNICCETCYKKFRDEQRKAKQLRERKEIEQKIKVMRSLVKKNKKKLENNNKETRAEKFKRNLKEFITCKKLCNFHKNKKSDTPTNNNDPQTASTANKNKLCDKCKSLCDCAKCKKLCDNIKCKKLCDNIKCKKLCDNIKSKKFWDCSKIKEACDCCKRKVGPKDTKGNSAILPYKWCHRCCRKYCHKLKKTECVDEAKEYEDKNVGTDAVQSEPCDLKTCSNTSNKQENSPKHFACLCNEQLPSQISVKTENLINEEIISDETEKINSLTKCQIEDFLSQFKLENCCPKIQNYQPNSKIPIPPPSFSNVEQVNYSNQLKRCLPKKIPHPKEEDPCNRIKTRPKWIILDTNVCNLLKHEPKPKLPHKAVTENFEKLAIYKIFKSLQALQCSLNKAREESFLVNELRQYNNKCSHLLNEAQIKLHINGSQNIKPILKNKNNCSIKQCNTSAAEEKLEDLHVTMAKLYSQFKECFKSTKCC